MRHAPADGAIVAPLSHQQRQLWFSEQVRPPAVTSNLLLGARLQGELDVEALERALSSLTARHDAMRTHFEDVGGDLTQCVTPAVPAGIPMENLSGLAESEQRLRVANVLSSEADRHFDLSTAPLTRLRLLRLSEREHVLVRTHHHIAYDGVSDQIFTRELFTLYDAYARRQSNPLRDPEIQYIDYTRAQLAHASENGFEKGLAFWSRELAGVPQRLDIPTSRPRMRLRRYRGAAVVRQLGPGLHSALRRACRSESVTTFMFMLGAFELLLARWSGQGDFAIGTPMSNRSRALRESIGCFANMVMLRSDVPHASTFRELLKRVRQRCLDSYVYQDVPLDLLIRRLDPQRDLNGETPIQIAFNGLNYPRPSRACHRLNIEWLPNWHRTSYSRFELSLYVVPDAELTVVAVYDTHLFDAREMEELLDQWRALLIDTIRDTDRPLQAYSLVTPSAKSILPDPAVRLRATISDSLVAQFDRQKEAFGERIAVTCAEKAFTYDCVDAIATRLACLIAQADADHKPVAILARRTPDLAIALIAVARAGSIWLVLDADAPVNRNAALIAKCGAHCILDLTEDTDMALALGRMMPTARHYIRPRIDELYAADTKPTWRGEHTLSPGSPAYIAFTSGSSGEPKAVIGTHGPIGHFIGWYADRFDLTVGDRFGVLSAIGHDPMLRDIFVPLSIGATVCVPPCSVLDREPLLAWAAREQLTVLHLSPALGRLLTAEGSSLAIPSLRYACFGGDVLTSGDIGAIASVAPAATIVNTYGTTETPQIMAYWIVSSDAGMSNRLIPIGTAIDDVQLLVLRPDRRLCGINERGEIVVRTPHLTLGYLNDAVTTDEKYVANIYTDEANDRMYRTGDFGWYGPDGNVYYAGRMDRQVKVRGFRVDPSEIQTALLSHESVVDAVVTTKGSGRDGDWLTAYVATANRRVTPRTLRQRLGRHLPAHMVPTAIVVMRCLPRTSTGKINLDALPAPVSRGRRTYSAPRNDVQRRLCAIVREVVGVDRVGIDDNFFELGGHSMAAVVVTGRVRAAWHAEVNVRDLFESPTVRSLSAVVRKRLPPRATE